MLWFRPKLSAKTLPWTNRYFSISQNKFKRRRFRNKQQYIQHENNVAEYINNITTQNCNKNNDLENVYNNLNHNLQVNQTHILGFSLKELSKRTNMFLNSGMGVKDAIAISLTMPSCFNLNQENFMNIINVLRKYNFPVAKFLYHYPYIGGANSDVIEENITSILTFVDRNRLFSLFFENPLLLMYPLSREKMNLLKKTNFEFSDTSTSLENLKFSLNECSLQSPVVEKLHGKVKSIVTLFNASIEFMNKYDLNLKEIYRRAPEFFFTEVDWLENAEEILSGDPFYFTAEEAEDLLHKYPDVFLQLPTTDVKDLIQYLKSVVQSKVRLYKLLMSQPEIFRDTKTFFQRVKLFEEYGIRGSYIGQLLGQKGAGACFIICNDFTNEVIERLLKLYFKDGNDISPNQVIFSSPICLSVKSKDIIISRLCYFRELNKVKSLVTKRKKSKSDITLQTLIRINQKDFLEQLCQTDFTHYKDFCDKNSLTPL